MNALFCSLHTIDQIVFSSLSKPAHAMCIGKYVPMSDDNCCILQIIDIDFSALRSQHRGLLSLLCYQLELR